MRNFLLLLLFGQQFFAQEKFLVYFETDEYELTNYESGRLHCFVESDSIVVQKIIGYCDYRSSDSYNQILSEKRAQFVYNLVKSKLSNSVELEGKGEEFIQDSNLQKNRKVEIYYFKEIYQIDKKIEFSDENKKPTTKNQNLKIGDKLVLKNLYFYNNSGIFRPKSIPVVEELLEIMLANPKLKIEIQGHICCFIGQDSYDIAKVRAFAVYKYLTDNGIAKKRLRYKSFGNTQPIHKIPEINDTQRNENRRVEILILEN